MMDGWCFPWTGRAGQTEKARPKEVLFCGRYHTIGTFDPVRFVDPEAANGVALASAGGWQQPLRPSPIQRPVSGVAPSASTVRGYRHKPLFPSQEGGNSQWNWPSLFLTDTGALRETFSGMELLFGALTRPVVVLCCAMLCSAGRTCTSFSSGQCR